MYSMKLFSLFTKKKKDLTFERLVRRLLFYQDDKIFIEALTEACSLSSNGDELGVNALSEAIRRRCKRDDISFYKPLVGKLKTRPIKEHLDANEILLELAKSGKLLEDPKKTQNLMSAALVISTDGLKELLLSIYIHAGIEQGFDFQLLYNQLSQSVKLRVLNGEQTLTQKMELGQLSMDDINEIKDSIDSKGYKSESGYVGDEVNEYFCDICGNMMRKTSGYSFNTAQVVNSVRYWEKVFSGNNYKDMNSSVIIYSVKRNCSYSTAWIVCNNCASLVDGDSSIARKFAKQNEDPPGCGPVDELETSIIAGMGWSLAFNEWPESVQIGSNPIIQDASQGTVCDFCKRIIYGDEKLCFIGDDRYKLLKAKGIKFIRDPKSIHDLHGIKYKVACSICVNQSGMSDADKKSLFGG